MIEQSPGFIGIHELDGTIRYMNAAAAHALGYEPVEMVGRNFAEYVAPEVRPFFWPAMERLRHERASEGLVPVITKAGGKRMWLFRHVLWEEPGQPACVLGDSADVTDLRIGDETLHESEQRFRYLAENIHQVFWIRDPRTSEILYLSPSYEEVWGRSRQGVLEQPITFLETVHPDDRPLVLGNFARSAQGELVEMEYRIVRPDGSTRWIASQSSPVRAAGGEVSRIIAITEDITERKHTEDALRRAKEAAEAAVEAKSQLLAEVSHEVRTPLQVIIGMTEMLLQSPLAAEQRADLERIEAASRSLHMLANDLLDFSKIEVRKLELRAEPFSLRAVVAQALEPFVALALLKGLVLHTEIGPEVPDELTGDADRLRQILTNLIGNATKFTERGKVTVAVERRQVSAVGLDRSGLNLQPPASSPVEMHFAVRDTGPGIAPEDRQRIFEPFSQAHAVTKREHGGAGLGLAICAQLVQLMGGTIGVDSEPGQGSTFHFTARFELSAR